MTPWTERILQAFPEDLSSFWIASDPDNLLLDENILRVLRDRGFEVLPFDDSIAFRVEYEERYRDAWDRGAEGTSKALVLQFQGADLNFLPWDYLRRARKVDLSLADLMPKLNASVIRQIDSTDLERLFAAHNSHASQVLGESMTKEFLLTHLFEVNPHLMRKPETFWREAFGLLYRGIVLPPVLAHYVAKILTDTALGSLPVEGLLSSKSAMARTVQAAWGRFLEERGVEVEHADLEPGSQATTVVDIPFDHADIRVIVDTLFLEGALQPVNARTVPATLPDWIRLGVIQSPSSLRDLVEGGIGSVAAKLPAPEATHRDWTDAAKRLAETIYRFHELPSEDAAALRPAMRALQHEADTRLREWVQQRFQDLPSLPVAKAPVMVHHIPRYLSMRRNAGEEKVALLVFDGMALDQWVQIREYLSARAPDLTTEESGCFAWLPSLTSVSRQALFSGLRPREFQASIETTAQEPSLWNRFWIENGLRAAEVCYRKAIKRTEQLSDLDAAISSPSIKVAGIVVDMIDELVHGAMLGKRGLSGQIREWCETGFVEKLLNLLISRGFQVYVTADHGNVDADGIGRLNQGVISEVKGERVRTYRNETLAGSVPADTDAFAFGGPGLPPDFLPLYASGRGAFVPIGQQVVAHGGMSVEELIVPFVKIGIRKEEDAA
ncbi:BREX-3 system phosphatase PglZ [Paracoccus marcusii]|uniref:BREX-3 system phosphatase PglZ n=1 Tax=Paracoccus marcusii TaxID=59779 RepID=UPI002491FAAE|nr:BREX-3 system phosphatase PglZ [Paracoccus marcusii]